MQKAIERKHKTRNFALSPKLLGVKQKMYDIMFVHNDEDQSVEVVESPTIDFNAIIEHLGEGNSIFIAPKIQRVPIKSNCKRHGYINHV